MKFAFFLTLALSLFFAGCDMSMFESEEKPAVTKTQSQHATDPDALTPEQIAQSGKLSEMALENKSKKELAEIAMKQETASMAMQKDIELQKVNADIELERIKQDFLVRENEHSQNMQIYLLLFATVVVIIIAAGLYVYFKRRHDDKLQAYNDNLQKYFHNKESTAHMKLAEKIIDKIASGKLTSEQESQLLNTLQDKNKPIPKNDEIIIDDADIIEQLPKKS